MKKISILFGLVVSLVLLYLAVRKTNVSEVLQHVRTLKLAFIVPMFFLLIFSNVVRSYRWYVFLEPIRRIGLGGLFSSLMIGYLGNNILPARLGEFIRAYSLKRKNAVSMSISLATILLERVLDGLFLLFLLSVLMIFFDFPVWVQRSGILVFGAFLLAIFSIFLMTYGEKTFQRYLRILLRFVPARFGQKIEITASRFVQGFGILRAKNRYPLVLSATVFIWLLEIGAVYLLMLSFGMTTSVLAPCVVVVLVSAGMMIPSAPGFVGTYQFFCVSALTLFSVPKDEALGFSIIMHFVFYATTTVIGFLCFTRENFSFTEVTKRSLNYTDEFPNHKTVPVDS